MNSLRNILAVLPVMPVLGMIVDLNDEDTARPCDNIMKISKIIVKGTTAGRSARLEMVPEGTMTQRMAAVFTKNRQAATR